MKLSELNADTLDIHQRLHNLETTLADEVYRRRVAEALLLSVCQIVGLQDNLTCNLVPPQTPETGKQTGD